MTMAISPEPQEMTAEQIRDHLAAGEEVWLWERGRPRHRVYNVEPLSADHAGLGADYQVYFKGATTGLMLPKHMSETDKLKAVARRPPAKETDGRTPAQDEKDSRGQAQHP
jgi:hypothetical protein